MKETRSLRGQRPPHMERVYVKVNSDFDATGYMQPRSITWADGRTFKIEAVKDYRPAACYRQGAEVLLLYGDDQRTGTASVFFEWTNSAFASRVARWYVEAATEAN